jgi:hypothetical protein
VKGLRRRSAGQWRDVSERRLRLSEPKARRSGGDQRSALARLGERVNDEWLA